jgi:glycine C-acetyltransferase
VNNDLRVKKIMIDSIKKDGTCIASSRLSCGTTNVHMRLEKKLADFIGGESCITYTLGYTANVGALSALSNKSDILLIDEKSHASLMDGCFLSESKMFTYRHNDMSDLKKKLNNLNGDKLIVTDGVFSMDGDLVKLDDVYDLAKKYNAGIYLDDAHGVGVLGKNGGGTPEHFGLKGKIDLVAGTLSKAISSQGGYVVGKKNIIDYLKHTSRSFIFNISLQHYFAEGALKAIDIIENEPDIRLKLWENVNFLKENLINLGFNLKESCTPIIPLIIGDDIKTSEISKILADNGIIVDAVFYPVVKRKESMVRIIVNKQHSQHDLIRIIDILEIVGKKFDLI